MSSRVWWTPGPPTQNIWWTSTKFGGLCPPNDGFFLTLSVIITVSVHKHADVGQEARGGRELGGDYS